MSRNPTPWILACYASTLTKKCPPPTLSSALPGLWFLRVHARTIYVWWNGQSGTQYTTIVPLYIAICRAYLLFHPASLHNRLQHIILVPFLSAQYYRLPTCDRAQYTLSPDFPPNVCYDTARAIASARDHINIRVHNILWPRPWSARMHPVTLSPPPRLL